MKPAIIILTHNEEENIQKCLDSVKNLSDEIIIIDSYSNDKTVTICKNYKCNIYSHKFENQAQQFNWALKNIDIKNNWILRLDADEQIPEKLFNEILNLDSQNSINGYYLNRRMYWMKKWLKHGRMYPHYILRLFRKGYGHYENKTEEHLIVKGECKKLKNDFFEDNEKNKLDYFTEKHLQTARGELNEIKNSTLGFNANGLEPKLFGQKINRTRWFKQNIYMRIPLFTRPLLYFLYRYFICLGFLDGRPGLIFHVLQAFWYRFYIDAKIYEDRLKVVKRNCDDV